MGLINLYDINNQEINMKTLELKGLKLHVPSPSYDLITEQVDGRGGVVVIDKVLRPRELIADFFFDSKDYTDSLLLRDDIFRLLGNGAEFYISESNYPNKRWKVHADMWMPERLSRTVNTITVPLIAVAGLSESVGTTLDPLTFDAEKWQVGQGLILDENTHPTYTHSIPIFGIYNAGDVAINPRKFPLKIIYRGASTNLKIENTTNRTEWSYNGTSGASDQITLDGVRSLKNDESIFRDTNKKLITIEPGWNLFKLSGQSGNFLISFEHRFYYF